MALKKTPTTAKAATTTVRYDVAFTLPFKEFSRQSYVISNTWWVDSMHRDQIAATKRFNAIKDAIAASNGSIVLFEVEADRGSDVFHQRAINRAGKLVTPPPITEINMIAVDIDRAFNEFLTRYQERKGKQVPQTQPARRAQVTVRKKKQSWTPWLSAAGIALALFGGLTASFSMQTPARSGGINGFNRGGQMASASTGGTRVEAPTVGYMIMPNDERKNGRAQCDVRRMDPRTWISVYDHSEDCR